MNWTAADRRRCRFGVFFLLAAGTMFIWGQTILAPYLTSFIFLSYWFLCFLLNLLAVFTAILDIRTILRYRDQLTGIQELKKGQVRIKRSKN